MPSIGSASIRSDQTGPDRTGHDRSGARRARTGLLAAGTAVALVVAGLALTPLAAAAAPVLQVTSTTDQDPSAIAACQDQTVVTPASSSSLSLREAICVANNRGGAQTIAVPAGTVQLQFGEFVVGTQSGSTITISGAGATATTLDAARHSRILELDQAQIGGISVSVSGMTLQNGLPSASGPSATFGGGAILAGADATPLDSLTIANAQFIGNTAASGTPTNAPGGAVQMAGGSLAVTDTTFTQNSAGESPGGAIAFLGGGVSGETLVVARSTFLANTVTNSGATGSTNSAGAVFVRGAASGSAIDQSTFTQNSATGRGPTRGGALAMESGSLAVTRTAFDQNVVESGSGSASGGAIAAVDGALTATFDRFSGNSASTGPSIAQSTASVTANDNWWNCTTGPTGSGCQSTSGTVTATTWLLFRASASPATVTGPNAGSTITGSFTTDSAGRTIAPANLGAFAGLTVSFTVPGGGGDSFAGGTTAVSGQSTASGATATYNSGTAAGSRTITAGVSGVPATTAVTVQRAPAVTSASSAGFTSGTAGSFTVTSTGSPTPTLSESGRLPDGLAFVAAGDGTATISGTPTTSGSTSITVSASNGVDPTAVQTLTITVSAAPAFTSAATARFSAGTAGSFTVQTTGSPAPAITATGTLPAGLTLQDNGDGTATLSGTTGQPGTYPLSLTASNGVRPNATQGFTVQVDAAPAVTTNPVGQSVQPGSTVSFSAAASGTPSPSVQWQRSTDGGGTYVAVFGATATTYSFTASAADDGSSYRAVFSNSAGTATTIGATLRVGTAPAFTSSDGTRVVAGRSLSFPVTTTGTPVATLTRSGSAFPSWLTFTDRGDGTGVLSGTAPVDAAGTASFTLRASNGFAPDATQAFTLTVDASPTITSAAATTFAAGTAGSFSVTTTGGFPTPTSIALQGTLPSGVTFVDDGDGTATLAGTPVAGTGGTYPLTIVATADGGTAPATTQSFVLTVDEAPTITSADHVTFLAGSAGSFTVTTAGGFPTSTALTVRGDLPSGMTFTDDGDGTATIAGTPAPGTGGTYPVMLSARAIGGGSAASTQSFTLTVIETPTITSAASTTFTAGVAGSFSVTTSGGFPSPPALTITGSLPDGVTFSDAGDGTATLSGTPSASTGGTYPVTITAVNGAGAGTSQAFTLTVDQAPTVTSPASATFRVGVAGSAAITTSAGVPGATTLSVVGDLPRGLVFTADGGSGTISGTPVVGSAGVSTVTVVADNGGGAGPVTQILTITVTDVPTITSADHATFAVGGAGTFTVTTAAGYPTATTIGTTDALPAGLTFRDRGDGTAVLSGTPSAADAGTVVLDVTATNATGSAPVQRLTLTITNAPVIAVDGPTSFAPGAPVSVSIGTGNAEPVPTLSLDTVDGPFLPAGLTFTDDGDGTATISGTPQGPSITDLVVVADNGTGGPVRSSFTLTIQGPPTITSAPTATFRVGTAGSFTVAATNGVPTDTELHLVGTLPDGLTFTPTATTADPAGTGGLVGADGLGTTTRTISGTPTAAGTYRFSLEADNGVGAPSVQAFVLTVSPADVVPGTSAGGAATGASSSPSGVRPGSGALAFTGGGIPWDVLAAGIALVVSGLVLTIRRRRRQA
ncbi:beta strand repeat-containing protein [Curtobacterium sp. RRHDQ10]|uniref:beta strand repeat-containing protein n=1 Tax=Curtobacterium phyllosphaerae TaxID=3413379 RepID=UPI003BF045DA